MFHRFLFLFLAMFANPLLSLAQAEASGLCSHVSMVQSCSEMEIG